MKSKTLSTWTFLSFLFLLAPILVLVLASFSPQPFLTFPPNGLSLRWYENFFHNADLVGSVQVSLFISAIVSIVAVSLGCCAAVALTRSRFPGRSIVLSVLLAPIAVPAILLGLAYLQFLSNVGLEGSTVGFVIAHATLALPYTTRTAAAALTKVDTNLEDAARSLGAGPVGTFARITLPQIRPGLIVGGILAFIVSFNDLPVALFISGPNTTTLPIRIFSFLQYSSDPTIAAVSSVMVLSLLIVVIVAERSLGITKYIAQID
jgi:putative spermidine/putrescine transport system permease protein